MTRFTRVFGIPRLPVHFARGLRFRLTVSYVLFFTVLLVAIGLFFRKTLQVQMEGDIRVALEEEWGAAKGYLRIENQRPWWFADRTDPEENSTVSRIKHVYFIADSNGDPLEFDAAYQSLGLDSPQEIRKVLQDHSIMHVRRNRSGAPYLVKAGTVRDGRGRPYFFAIGRSLQPARERAWKFMRGYLLALLLITGAAGWLFRPGARA